MFIKYMITDPAFSLNQTLQAVKTHKPDFVCYRNKLYYDEKEILAFAGSVKKHSKIFINSDSVKNENIADIFSGIHITSQKPELIDYYKNKNKTVIVSTHNKKEVLKAKNADFITFSPVFNSKNRPGLGIEALNKICRIHPNVIALGGVIAENEILQIRSSLAKGFASIRYFYV